MRVQKITSEGFINTVAGNGIAGYSGDGDLATSAELFLPTRIAVDATGELLIADFENHRIRKATWGRLRPRRFR